MMAPRPCRVMADLPWMNRSQSHPTAFQCSRQLRPREISLPRVYDPDMRRLPSIKAVMTPFPYSVDVAAPVTTARALMHEHQISHLPVTRDGELAGIIAERDILLLLGTDPVEGDRRQPPVTAAMVKDTYIVDMDTRLDEVLNHMADHHLSSAIVTRRGKLVGVFTVADACRHFAEFLQEQVRRSGGDDAA